MTLFSGGSKLPDNLKKYICQVIVNLLLHPIKTGQLTGCAYSKPIIERRIMHFISVIRLCSEKITDAYAKVINHNRSNPCKQTGRICLAKGQNNQTK